MKTEDICRIAEEEFNNAHVTVKTYRYTCEDINRIASQPSGRENSQSWDIDSKQQVGNMTFEADYESAYKPLHDLGSSNTKTYGCIQQVTGRQSAAYQPYSPVTLPPRLYMNPQQSHDRDEAYKYFLDMLGDFRSNRANIEKNTPAKVVRTVSFSPAFNAVLGPNNVQNCSGLEDVHLLEDVFTALVERAAIAEFREQGSRLNSLMDVKHPVRATAELKGETLHWTVDGSEGTGAIAFFVMLFNLARKEAQQVLADALGLTQENLHQMSSVVHAAEHGRAMPLEDIPERLVLGHTKEEASLTMTRYINGSAAQIIGAYVWYQSRNGCDFVLPATVGMGKLCVSRYKPTAYWLNQDQLDKFPHAPVILFQDARTAMTMMKELEAFKGYTEGTFIITAHLSSELSVLRWDYLHRHHVIFVPAPRLYDMMAVEAYAKYAMGTGARGFSVYPDLILHDCLASDFHDQVEGLTEGEKALLKNAITIDAIDRPIAFCGEVIHRALPYDAYIERGQEMGFFKKSTDIARSTNTKSKDTFTFFTLENCTKQEMPMNIKDVTLHHILPQASSIVLHGLKDSGKSMVVLAAVKHLLDSGERVLIIDTETLPNVLANRIHQMKLYSYVQSGALRIVQKTVQSCNFDFLDDSMHEQMLKISTQNGITYIVFDNITSGVSNGSMYWASMMAKFHSLEENLHKHNIGTIVVSHSKDNSKACSPSAVMRGSQEGSVRAHTEVVIIDHRHIVAKKLGPVAVQKVAAQQEGLTLGVILKVCKAAPILTDKTFWLHLPLASSDWQLLTVTNPDGEEIPLEGKGEAITETDELDPGDVLVSTEEAKLGEGLAVSRSKIEATSVPLSPDQRKTLNVIRESSGSMTCDGVKNVLRCSKDKTLKLLNELIELGLIQRHGKSRGIYYTLPTAPK